MDLVTVVVTAVALGAATGLTEASTQSVKDAYEGLKSLISRKYREVDVSGVERKPDSETKRASLAEDLRDSGAAGDTELGEAAAVLLEAVRQHAPQAVIGVDVEGLVAAALSISDVESAGGGVRVKNSRIAGPAEISGVRAGLGEPQGPGSARA